MNIPLNNPTFVPRINRLLFNRKPGVTAVEMGVILLIITAIVTLALTSASRVLGQSEVTEEASNLAMLSSAIRSTRTGAGYSSDIMADLEAVNGIPGNMAYVDATNTLSNRWTGAVTFTQLSSGAHFGITYASIPEEECVQLLMTFKQGVLRSVGSGATPSAWTNISDITASGAETICSGGTVTWSSQPA
tara:strand:- start:26845 stop:27414 length:570 start_codon:yes stop_codon:yes gene_type:complete